MMGEYQSVLQVHEGPVPLGLRIDEQLQNALKAATRKHSLMVDDSGNNFYDELTTHETKDFDHKWELLRQFQYVWDAASLNTDRQSVHVGNPSQNPVFRTEDPAAFAPNRHLELKRR